MRRSKRFMLVLLLMATLLAFGTVVKADQIATAVGQTPSEADRATVQIGGFGSNNVTITAYEIVKATYYAASDTQTGFKGYVVVGDESRDFVVENGTDSDGNPKYEANYPTSDEISLLAKDVSGFRSFTSWTLTKGSDGKYTATCSLPAGEFLVVAEDTTGVTVFNPMLVSVYYIDNGEKIAVDPITVNDNWGGGLAVTNAYAKSTTQNPEKKIADDDIAAQNSGEHGTDKAIGDTVKFTLDQMTIPSYSAQYFTNMTTETIQNSDGTTTTKKVLEEKTSETAVVFKIEDQMDPGITLKAPIEIKVGGSVFATISEADLHSASKEEANYTYKYQAASGTEGERFEVTLKKAYLKTLANKSADARAVEVNFEGQINENATTNFNPNRNTMTVKYTNKPTTNSDNDETNKIKEVSDTVYVYTFEIDGKIAGKGTGVRCNQTTHELIKINERGEVIDEKKYTENGQTEEYEVPQAVQGAVFSLTKTDNPGKDTVYYAVTDKNGFFVSFDQYKANGGPRDSFGSGSNLIQGTAIKGFRQMDVGTYKLKEIIAPEGFTIDATEHPVVITASYYPEDTETAKNGQLKEYSITIDGEQNSTYNATYDAGIVEKVVSLDEGDVKTTYIKNTRIPVLPSTGGIGTYIFTIAGVAILGVAVVLVLKGRRKES